MPLKTIDEMVKNRLAFIPSTEWQTDIDDFRIEQSYYLSTYVDLGIENPTDTQIEDEANWTGRNKILLAEVVTYQLLVKKIVETMGGDENSSVGSGSKMIKSAKADVVEAEFEYAKADDGRTLATKVSSLIDELKENICRYSQALGFYLPGFCKDIPEPTLPAFQVMSGTDFD